MMTSSKPWKTSANNTNLSKVITPDTNGVTVKKNAGSEERSAVSKVKIITPKRYSFDDNGGGYQGL